MPQDRLNELLKELRLELEGLDLSETEIRERLSQVLEQGPTSLELSPDSEAHQNFLSQLEDSITHFEVTHPRMTQVLNEIFTLLSNAGI